MFKKFKASTLLLIILLFLLTACSGGNDNISNEKEEDQSIPLLKDTVVEAGDFSFKVLEYYLIKSENDAIKDSVNIYEKINNTTVDSTQLGFDIGFQGSKAEVSKRDSYLLLTLDYNPDKNEILQRDSVIPKMNIKAVDNEDDNVILLHNSMDNKYIQVENPIGVLVFKIFGDAEEVNFKFNGEKYLLKLK
ncbi:hypothetical protein KQI41_18800 [Tissierella pigra]|uniref:DUF4352 domain-containing protein n=1 Tax=Tissierella pigra TaxID=2607614 RepID=A0A6N7XZY3_9FIRM|nr:hypothetical protein [Tissierella pigra]MBU5428443.1 hypothetical protein [Tissierella pigra]MSU02164.1 hypothetical protein [Tissierella pigra]